MSNTVDPVTTEQLKAILDGCEGVTAGSWRQHVPDRGYCIDYVVSDAAEVAPDKEHQFRNLIAECEIQHSPGDPQRFPANAAHIARLDPQTVASIITELLALRASQDHRSTMGAGWRDVLAERERQKSIEGWTAAHDDRHWNGSMAWAAACYAIAHWSDVTGSSADVFVSKCWPWAAEWWKPTTRRRDLVKAGALILAEIERLDRLPSPPSQVLK